MIKRVIGIVGTLLVLAVVVVVVLGRRDYSSAVDFGAKNNLNLPKPTAPTEEVRIEMSDSLVRDTISVVTSSDEE